MRNRLSLCFAAVLLMVSSAARAQITPTFTFTAGTVADPDQVNANFALLGSALNRTGGTMTGTLTSRDILPDVNNTRGLGNGSFRFAVVFATTFDGSGANLTNIPETAITDGALLARVGGTETITATWTFTQAVAMILSSTAPQITFLDTDQAADAKKILIFNDAGLLQFARQTDAGANTVLATLNRANGTLTVGGSAVTGDGAVGTPAWSFSADPDTGFYRTTNNTIHIATGGAALGTLSSTGLNLTAAAGVVTERGRAFAMGATQTRAFAGGNYTATGGGSWTVESGDVTGESWRVVGDTLTYNLFVDNTTISGTVTSLNIAIPGGFTAQEVVQVAAHFEDGTNQNSPICQVAASGSVIAVAFFNGAAFGTGTNNMSVRCQISFKVS